MLELACSPVSSGDATHMEEIHRLTRVTARGLHLPRHIRHRQGTQWQRQADAGLWAEKVGIVRIEGELGSSYNPGAAINASLFPRLARAA